MTTRKFAKCLILLTFIACGKKDGPAGESGRNGAPGLNGSNGTGCTIVSLNAVDAPPKGGALITCGSSSTVLLNGADGATSAYSVVEVIDPCGPQGAYDEVLLRLSNGKVLASFSANANGDYTRFSLLPDGGFATTDQTNCAFTLSTAGNTRSLVDSTGTKTWTF